VWALRTNFCSHASSTKYSLLLFVVVIRTCAIWSVFQAFFSTTHTLKRPSSTFSFNQVFLQHHVDKMLINEILPTIRKKKLCISSSVNSTNFC
jgi:hypothetical protein